MRRHLKLFSYDNENNVEPPYAIRNIVTIALTQRVCHELIYKCADKMISDIPLTNILHKLKETYDEKHNNTNDVFRYRLNIQMERILPGKLRFLVQVCRFQLSFISTKEISILL